MKLVLVRHLGLRQIGSIGIIVLIVALPFTLLSAPRLPAQGKATAAATEFRQLAAQLSNGRLDGTTESKPLQDKVLALLDGIALPLLDSSPKQDLDAVNAQLVALVAPSPSVGENYRFARLGGTPSSYALVANLGFGGPAAIRIYSSSNGHFGLAAQIDSFSQKDFFDSDIDLISMSSSEPVFVTVAGRTDDLSTGVFSAWRFNGHAVTLLWNSDLLQQSSYETDDKGLHVTYCAEPDEDHPRQCPKMESDLYQWQAGEWKRLESKNAAPANPAKQ
jgi:hypothetical protein